MEFSILNTAPPLLLGLAVGFTARCCLAAEVGIWTTVLIGLAAGAFFTGIFVSLGAEQLTGDCILAGAPVGSLIARVVPDNHPVKQYIRVWLGGA